MAPNKDNRIVDAVDRLIGHLIPTDPHEEEEVAAERHDNCFELVRAILESPASPAISSDVNHASDMIKRKLIQTNPSQALRFSNLYSRLLSLPVLTQKWAILYLLYQLADSPDPDEPLPLTPRVRQQPPRQPRAEAPEKRDGRRQPSKSSAPAPRSDEEAFNEAFAQSGLKKVPAPQEKVPAPAPAPPPQGSPKRDVAVKSRMLADNYAEIDPAEPIILRDLPFTLQGLSSTTMPFGKRDTLALPPTLPAPIISLLHTLAEPSLLYRRLDAFVKSPSKGLLGQSLRAAVASELKSYLSLIATLEVQIRRTLSTLDDAAPRGGIGAAGVTLKRCVVWTREPTMGLRLLGLIAEESEKQRGGRLISMIHNYSSGYGDPVVAQFAERLLGQFTRPFYEILRHWIYDGELVDPYLEFFVREQTPGSEPQKGKHGSGGASGNDAAGKAKAKAGGNSVWEDKYELDPSMVPSIITQDFAQKVFLIGKSLNFLRHSCGDAQWVADYSKRASKELRYGDTAALEAQIDEAHRATMERLMRLMDTKFHLFRHLQALKDYILLGQGDFIALLMESLAANLDRPAGAQYRHTLTAQLENAIRGSNAQFDSPEVLRRLDARMLQLSHGDIGWDCFTLEYKIDSPVDVVVTDWGNRQYLKVFNFLWRIKRVEFALSSTWRRCMTGARGVLQAPDPAVRQVWKSTRGVLAEMVHFVGQLQYYILFEVIESSWEELQRRIRRDGCTLDDLITAHTRYLTDITHKGLLGARRRSPNAPAAEGEDDRTSYLAQLGDLLRTMLVYRDSVDGLYSWSVGDFTRRQESDVRTTSAASRLQGGGADADPPAAAAAPSSEFPALQERLRHLAASFRTRLQILLGDLAYQPDVDMRFLGVAMNFNDVYQPARRKAKVPPSAASAPNTRA